MITIHIPCKSNTELLLKAIQDLYFQVDKFYIINNTDNEQLILSDPENKVEVITPIASLCYEQSLYASVKHSIKINSEYCLWAHTDIEVKPGAIQLLLEKYEEVKNSKWGVIYGQYDALCLFNPQYFINEHDKGDIFTSYFGDNNRYRRMNLLGYNIYNADKVNPLVNHIGSHNIKFNSKERSKNDLLFGLTGQLYQSIWGGMPGCETVTDPNPRGLYI